MRVRRRNPLLAAAAVLAAALALPAAARAQENLLHGPHPFLKDNALDVHVLIGESLSDALSGAKLGFDYAYKMTGGVTAPLWLDLQINFEHAGCNSSGSNLGVCGTDTGDLIETMAGVKWTFATPLPLVPFLKSGAGLLFAFPNGATNAAGIGARFSGGANYFFFDWLGLGAEVGFSFGRIDYDSTFKGSHNYAVLDFGGGLEFQF